MKLLLAKLWKALQLPKSLQLSIMRVTQDQFLIGVSGIIFNTKNEVLLFKHTYRKNPWSLPGGYLKAKEHPVEGLQREIKEESGLVVSVDTRLQIRTDQDSARLDMCYVGVFIGGTFKPSDEVVAAKFFSFDTPPLMIPDQVVLIRKALEQRKISRQLATVSSLQKQPKTFVQKIFHLFHYE